MSRYDVVIIGSGLGGLLCGEILSKEGMKVCILEKQHFYGGNLQTFKRDGKIFDTGIHYVGGLSEGQNLHQYFKYFGIIDKLKFKQLDLDAFDKIHFQEKEYSYAQGFDRFVETLTKEFPKEKQSLQEYKNKIKEICSHFSLYNLRPHNNSDNEKQYYEKSIGDFIGSITSDKTLQNVLAGNNMLYAGIPDKTPVAIHALINNSLIDSAYRFVDGSQQIADNLVESIEKNGGVLKNNSKVTKLDIKHNRIGSAILSNGETIEANYFISSVHPYLTIDMIDSKILRNSYRNRIKELEETISVFSIYISFKPNSFKYLNYNYYHFNANTVWNIQNYKSEKWPQEYLFLTLPTSNSFEFAETAAAMAYMKYDEVKYWEKFEIGKRGNDYEEFKKQKAEKLIDQINKQFPGFRDSIENYYTSTPLSLKDYTGTRNGSMYGIMHDCNNALQTRISTKTKIPNLLLTGQNINIHGVLGVTVGSIISCSHLIGMEYLMKKVNDA